MKHVTDTPLICEMCHTPFVMGDTIYPLRLALVAKDLCVYCKDKVLMHLEGWCEEDPTCHETAN